MRVGVLTSGGDSPGMNAVIHGACSSLQERGGVLVGFRRGLAGLVENEVVTVDPFEALAASVVAGTMLGTSRSRSLLDEGSVERAVANVTAAALDGVIVVGGNGSLKAAQVLASRRLPVSFVPATIDNDVPGSDRTIGFDSAIAYATDVISRLRVTAAARPGRAFLVETLGGDNGNLARAVGTSSGVGTVLTLEEPIELQEIAHTLKRQMKSGAAIAIVCEGAGSAVNLALRLTTLCEARIHPTVLGHAQRAADPSHLDLTMGRLAGEESVAELLLGRSRFISFGCDGTVRTHPLSPNTSASRT